VAEQADTPRAAISLLTLYPEIAVGTHTYARRLLGALSEMAGSRCVALTNDAGVGAYSDLRGPGLEVLHVESYEFGRFPGARVGAMLATTAWPRRVKAQLPIDLDVMHYPATVPVPRLRSVPTIVSLHDVLHLDHPEFFSRRIRAWRRIAYDSAAVSATMLLTGSEHARKRICSHLDLDPKRVRVVRHGIDLERFTPSAQPNDEEILQRAGLAEPYIYYPAGLFSHKNHYRLVAALGRMSDSVLLVLTGQDFGKRDALLSAADEAGVRARHLGRVPDSWLPTLFRHASALVFPSLYEGFGAPVVEAMASGCPVVCSNRGSLPEVVGEAALTFDPQDEMSMAHAIERTLTDDELRDRNGRAGLARARTFSWTASAAGHLDAYAEAAQLSPRARSGLGRLRAERGQRPAIDS
jgi:glycosyltransferase involved in cell wall biosynthesis